jgi:hypothetical protein
VGAFSCWMLVKGIKMFFQICKIQESFCADTTVCKICTDRARFVVVTSSVAVGCKAGMAMGAPFGLRHPWYPNE